MKTLLLVPLVALAACAAPAPERPLSRDAAPRGLVIVVHGAFPDGVWSSWDEDEVALLESEGVLAARLDYRCHGFEYMFTDEIERTSARLARILDAVEAAHARTGCPTPLRLAGVGYSAGTTVLLQAALAGTTFHDVTFGGSPIFFASGDLERALVEKKMEHLTNYCSLVDGLIWPVLPCGIWGYTGNGMGAVENRLTLQVHAFFPFAWNRERIAAETVRSFGKDEHRVCMADPAFREAWLRARRHLEDRTLPD